MDNQEAIKAIIGWLSYKSGGRVDGVKPEGFETAGEGDGWNEELWCYDRVEAALGVYKQAFQAIGYLNLSGSYLRHWLKDLYWESKPLTKHRDYEHLVAMEIAKFKELVQTEVARNPRPKFFKT